MIVADAEELYSYARKAHEAGWQLGTHANGDVGIGIVLDLYERLQREMPRRDPRYRIEHCTRRSTTRWCARIKALGVDPDAVLDLRVLPRREDAGVRRGAAELACSRCAVSSTPASGRPGLRLSAGTLRADDGAAIHGDAHRHRAATSGGRARRSRVEEALRVCTLNGAYASFEEHEKGSLEPGKLADLVVLGRNPLTEDPSSLVTIPVERTMVGGRWVYES